MLDQTQIQVSCLLLWAGFIFGGGFIAASAFTGSHFATMGLALLVLSSAYWVRRAIDRRDKALRDAFEFGRESERPQRVRPMR